MHGQKHIKLGYININIFCHCSLFPSWSGWGLISTRVQRTFKVKCHPSMLWCEDLLELELTEASRRCIHTCMNTQGFCACHASLTNGIGPLNGSPTVICTMTKQHC